MSKEHEQHLPAIASLTSRLETLESLQNLSDHLITHSQESIEKCFERIEELKKDFLYVLKSDKNSHKDGIECSCRLDNKAHDIKTKSVLNDLWTRQKLLEETVNILKEKREAQFDYESFAFAFKDTMDKIDKKIEKLEKWKEAAIDKNIQDVNRMREIEKHFSGDYQLVASTKKPHKCPVCDGIGGTKISGVIDEFCDPCAGKGIVWG